MTRIRDLSELTGLAEDIAKENEGYTDVAVGLRPSGIIHLGNMATISLAGLLAREIGPHISKVNTTICDLDLPDMKDWNVSEKGHVRYFRDLPDKHRCHENMLQHALEGIKDFTERLSTELEVKFNINLLSDIQRTESFRNALRKVLDSPKLMQFLLPRAPSDAVLVYPLCPNCGTGSNVPTIYKGGGLLQTVCSNVDCPTKEYSMNIDDCSKDLAVHYFIDPMRDRAISPKSAVHIFGGDYRESHAGGESKIEKILKVMEIATGETSEILIGPVFYARDGGKMSKSKENGLTMENLRRHFGETYTRRVLELMKQIISKGFKNVDYKIVDAFLFDGK
jgi:lysyl-tRNA synthetase class I